MKTLITSLRSTLQHAILFVALLAMSRIGFAQYYLQSPIEPIRTSEMLAIADATDMTELQRRELILLHKEYRKQIADDESLWFHHNEFEIVVADSEEDYRVRELANARMDQLQLADAQYFQEIRNILHQSQYAALDRHQRYLQRQRIRSYYLAFDWASQGWDQCDLPSYIEKEDVPEGTRDEFFKILDAYDIEYTARHALLTRQAQQVSDKIKVNMDAAKLRYEEVEGTLSPQDARDAYREYMDDAGKLNYPLVKRLVQHVIKHRKITRETYETLRDMLQEKEAAQFTYRYIRHAYGLTFKVSRRRLRCTQCIEDVLALEHISNESREELLQLDKTIRGEFDLIQQKMIKLIDENTIVSFYGIFLPRDDIDVFYGKVKTLNDRSFRVMKDSMKIIESHMLDDIYKERWEQIKTSALRNVPKSRKQTLPKRTQGAPFTLADYVLPDPLDVQHCLFVIDQCDQDHYVTTAPIQEAVRQYQNHIEQRFIPLRTKLDESSMKLREQGVLFSDEVDVFRQKAFDELKKAEETLFDAILWNTEDEAVTTVAQHVKALRERARYVDVFESRSYLRFGFDIVDLLSRALPQLLIDAEIQPLLKRYEEEALPLFKRSSINEIILMKMMVPTEEAHRLNTELQQSTKQLYLLGREILDAIVLVYPDDPQVRRKLFRVAYPDVYDDPTVINEELWQRVQEIEDLESRHLVSIAPMLEQYTAEYDRLSEEILGLVLQELDDETKRNLKEEITLDLRRQDRIELNEITIATLNSLLSKEQLRSIGGLPVPLDTRLGLMR